MFGFEYEMAQNVFFAPEHSELDQRIVGRVVAIEIHRPLQRQPPVLDEPRAAARVRGCAVQHERVEQREVARVAGELHKLRALLDEGRD